MSEKVEVGTEDAYFYIVYNFGDQKQMRFVVKTWRKMKPDDFMKHVPHVS